MDFLKLFYNFELVKPGTVIGHCQICGSQYTDKAGSTGNFHKHLKRKHKEQYDRKRKHEHDASSSDQDGDSNQQIAHVDEKVNELIASNLIVKCNLQLNLYMWTLL